MIAGGFDDLSEEGSYEFANMKATSNAETEFAMGHEPPEMSCLATTTRSGVSLLCCVGCACSRIIPVHAPSTPTTVIPEPVSQPTLVAQRAPSVQPRRPSQGYGRTSCHRRSEAEEENRSADLQVDQGSRWGQVDVAERDFGRPSTGIQLSLHKLDALFYYTIL